MKKYRLKPRPPNIFNQEGFGGRGFSRFVVKESQSKSNLCTFRDVEKIKVPLLHRIFVRSV
ncbi:hypothetical protein MNBD_GAMMA26-2618 [hydrothermal vent metagenome]|uniref:Uncharacterized protein n=1 Tax=hydrothermal vent metagenome TaxID=652676 RepID=A0A3B1B1C5_9ZZZZ